MSTTGEKIVIDTNIFITIIGKQSPNRWIFDKIINNELRLCISNDILLEYQEILTLKTSIAISRNITDFLLLNPNIILTDIFFNWKLIFNDPDDNKFIDCVVASGANCLLTNDAHFNVLKNIDFPKINVFNLGEFEKEYKN